MVLIFFSCFPATYAQWEWEWQNPLPQGNTLNKIYFADMNKGWTVGVAGIIMTTNNGGKTWTVRENHVDEDLLDLFVVDGKFVWAVGYNGTILKSINGGYTWVDFTFNTTQHLNAVFFMNPLKGWVIGSFGTIYSTDDGGFTWTIQQLNTDFPLKDIYFINDSTGWIAAGRGGYWNDEGLILKTTDGGQNWFPITNNYLSYQLISFCDSIHGWIFTAYDGFQKTDDGGVTWEYYDHPLSLTAFRSVYFVSPEIGFLNHGVLQRTYDGGITWSPFFYHTQSVNDYYFINSKVGWAACWAGAIYKTINAGTTTQRLTQGYMNGSLNDVCFINKDMGWAAGTYTILRTIDGGNHWIKSEFPNKLFDAIFFFDELYGWVQGSNKLMLTTDGGINWEEVPNSPLYYINSIVFTNRLFGWAVGKNGGIFHTTDGGYNWNTIDCPTDKNLYDISFPTPEKAWIVGLDGTILHSNDSGLTWVPQTPANLWHLTDVVFTDELNGWACGTSENFMYTRDGGQTWTYQPLPTVGLYSYKGLSFCDSLHGWLGAYYYKDNQSPRLVLYYTSDGGYTWDYTTMRIGSPIEQISFPDPENGWIVGYRGTIVHIMKGGIPVGTDEFNLNDDHNISNIKVYPNPSRNSSNIEYILNVPSKVKIQIYSTSGSLEWQFEEMQSAGQQKQSINVSIMKPGIYIYSLETKNWRKTGKFIIAGN